MNPPAIELQSYVLSGNVPKHLKTSQLPSTRRASKPPSKMFSKLKIISFVFNIKASAACEGPLPGHASPSLALRVQ